MKKVLAWAVVLALVLSSFTMAFAGQAKTSKDFSDADQIQYKEAVDVMVATGVIDGFPDGTFGPQKTVTRAQMAKMISVILNGGEDVNEQYKSACPFADSKNHWAAGNIAYCAAEHIIDGRSADVFDPDKDVTGTEVAKMALTSLGYDSKIQGYVGENWAAAVLKDAKKNNLFKGLDSSFVPGDPCSRDAAAQILFNMLKANMVEYDNGTSVSIGDDINVVVDSKIKDQTWPDANADTAGYQAPDEDDNADGVKQLYEEVFGGDLSKSNDNDESGRPAHEWTFDGDDVGTYPDSAALEFTANDSKTFNKALKEEDSAMWDKFFKAKKQENTVTQLVVNGKTESPDAEVISLGDKVELFDLDTKSGNFEAYKVVVTKYFPAKITEVNTDLDEEVLEDHAAEVTLKIFKNNQSTEETLYDDEIPNFDASTYVKDAVIAVAPDESEAEATTGTDTTATAEPEFALIDSYVAKELATGTVTKIKGTTVTIDGTAYDQSEVYAKLDKVSFAAKTDFTVYDYNGYVFASEKVSEDTDKLYGVLTSNKTDESGWEGDSSTKLVRIFTSEGETAELALADGVSIDGIAMNSLVCYTLNDDGDVKTIVKDTNAPRALSGQKMKTGGILYGKEVSKDVVAFANTKDVTDATAKDEWVAYGFDDLESADEVAVSAYFDEDGALVAMMVGSLEETSEVYGFVTAIEDITNADNEPALEITAFVNGEEKTYESKKAENGSALAQAKADFNARNKAQEPAVFGVLTFDGNLVKSVAVAPCVGVNVAGEDFPTGAKAVFYYNATPTVDMAYKALRPVISKSETGTSLDVGTAEVKDASGNVTTEAFIDFQTVASDAAIYYINDKNEIEKSTYAKIKVGCPVVLMQVDKDSATWDTVFFKDAPKN